MLAAKVNPSANSAAATLAVLGRARARMAAGEASIMAALASASPSRKTVDINRNGPFDCLRQALGAVSADQLENWALRAHPLQIEQLFVAAAKLAAK